MGRRRGLPKGWMGGRRIGRLLTRSGAKREGGREEGLDPSGHASVIVCRLAHWFVTGDTAQPNSFDRSYRREPQRFPVVKASHHRPRMSPPPRHSGSSQRWRFPDLVAAFKTHLFDVSPVPGVFRTCVGTDGYWGLIIAPTPSECCSSGLGSKSAIGN